MALLHYFKLNEPEHKFKINKSELILSSLVINLLSLALPVMVLQVYDRIMVNYNSDALIVFAVLTVMAIILEAIMRSLRSYINHWGGTTYEYSLLANSVRRYINADAAKLQHEGAGRRLQNLAAFTKLKDFYGGQALTLLIDIPFLFLFLFLLYYIAGVLVVVPIIFIGLFALLSIRLSVHFIKALRDQDEADDNKYNFIIESLRGSHSIKSYGLEFLFKKKFQLIEEQAAITGHNTALVAAKTNAYSSLLTEIMVITIVAIGAPLVISDHLTTGGLVVATLLSGKLMQPIYKAMSLWQQYQEYVIGREKADELFTTAQIIRNTQEHDVIASGSLKVDNLAIIKNRKEIIGKAALSAKAPSIIAIHGKNDEQKNVFLKAIMGEIRPSKGEILVDGVRVDKFNSDDLVNHIGLIGAEGVIFEGSILDNITGFNKKNEPYAKEIAVMLGIDKRIATLPKGYDTKISDGLVDHVSPGVKHRIAIARVLVNRPKILLVNNADKDLDSEGYIHLSRLISNLKKEITIILVSEDENIYRLASKHYIFKNKELIETNIKYLGEGKG